MGERLLDLQYKTFDELLDSVRTDMRSWELEGLIEPMELIKVAQRVTYDLGLKLNSTKETILDIEHGRAKLPADFEIMNFALLCHKYRTVTPTVGSGLETRECILENYLSSGCTSCTDTHDDCPVVDQDPWKQDKVQTRCNGAVTVQVIQYHSNQVRCYEEFERIYFVPSKQASTFCVNTQFKDCRYEAQIKNGFIYTSLDCGKLYVNYQGAMEDEDGNLLVLSHKMIDEYYEWALKERLLTNLYMNGEPDIERRLQLAKTELKNARSEANNIVNMVDYYDLKETLDRNRQIMQYNYFIPYSKYFGNTNPFAINEYRFGPRSGRY